MDQAMQRRCRHCRADIPNSALACPSCGRYFDGGFDFPELVDGVRSGQPALTVLVDDPSLEAEPSMLPGFMDDAFAASARDDRWAVDAWRSRPRPGSRSSAMGQAHSVHLPRVGEVTDLPYASSDDELDDDPDVIDLRDRRAQPQAGRSWLTRRRTRT